MKHVLSIVVNNSFGVLSRVTNLFARRGYNIDSVAVGETDDSSRSVITISLVLSQESLELLKKQLYKLVDVITVSDLTGNNSFERELLLISIKAGETKRHELVSLGLSYGAKMIDASSEGLSFELVGSSKQVDSFIQLVSQNGILFISRTGIIAIKHL